MYCTPQARRVIQNLSFGRTPCSAPVMLPVCCQKAMVGRRGFPFLKRGIDSIQRLPFIMYVNSLIVYFFSTHTADVNEHQAAGLMMNVLMNSFYGTCNLLGPAQGVPSLELIDSLLDHGSVQIWSIIPSLVDDIGENPGVHTKFRNSKAIIASGGKTLPRLNQSLSDSARSR